MTKPRIIFIESTDDNISKSRSKGVWSRHLKLLTTLAADFDIDYYTSDNNRLQQYLPQGVTHIVNTLSPNIYGISHMLFYFLLIAESRKWRVRQAQLIFIDGVNQPVTPVIKHLSKLAIVSRFHYDWAHVSRLNYSVLQPKHLLGPLIQRQSLKASDQVICTTRYLSTVARRYCPNKQIQIFPNSVDPVTFSPKQHKSNQIVFVGRLHWSKGADLLIKAFISNQDILGKFRLIIIGNGHEYRRLSDLARGFSNIELAGPLPNHAVANILNQSQIFVLPSRTMEGHPIALCEAMMAGCTCVASDVSGNRDIMMDADCKEYLFQPNDPQSLADCLLYAVKCPSPKQRQFALSHYSDDILLSQLCHFLFTLVSQKIKQHVDPIRTT